MVPSYTREELLRMNKKQVIMACGYRNIKHLCNENKELCVGGKAPSKKQLIKLVA